jgi:hypothetical protein
MKKTLIAILMIVNSMSRISAQQITLDNAFQLSFVDSFNNGTNYLNTTNWSQKFGWNVADSVHWVHDTVAIGYRKWYVPITPAPVIPSLTPYDTTNFKTSGGILSLWQRKENYSGNCWTWPQCDILGPTPQCNASACQVQTTAPFDTFCWHGQYKQFQYTAGMLLGHHRFKFGYFELRFKLPPAVTAPDKYSAGPNFWLAYSDSIINWSEIDIFEINGRNNLYTSNIHYRHAPQTSEADHKYINYVHPSNISANTWHTAGCLWTGNAITFFLDGAETYKLNNPLIKPDSLNLMPMIIDINAPVEHLGEVFDPVYSKDYQYQIDYVKVWQLQEECDTIKTYCSTFNPATYISKLYKSISIGGSGCSDAITNTANLGLYATDFVLLDDGFSIDANSTISIDIQRCDGGMIYAPSSTPQPPPDSWLQRHGN